MIVSASRRTDIPALYSKWFMNRLDEGYVFVPNPRNPHRLARVDITPENLDCIVFWTKNPMPMAERFEELERRGIPFYVQYTLTPYDKTIEPYVPSEKALLEGFAELSRLIGPSRCVWRYDPILIDERHSVAWHVRRFAEMSSILRGCTNRCVLSFVDPYKSLRGRFRAPSDAEMRAVAAGLSLEAGESGMRLFTCAEHIDLAAFGIEHGACIDRETIESVAGKAMDLKEDPNQRAACRCVQSVDIGVYDTCPHGCAYCYATSSAGAVRRNFENHDVRAPMITGYPIGDEIITDRTVPSNAAKQLPLF